MHRIRYNLLYCVWPGFRLDNINILIRVVFTFCECLYLRIASRKDMNIVSSFLYSESPWYQIEIWWRIPFFFLKSHFINQDFITKESYKLYNLVHFLLNDKNGTQVTPRLRADNPHISFGLYMSSATRRSEGNEPCINRIFESKSLNHSKWNSSVKLFDQS